MSDGKIDFSLIDPQRDPQRWESMVQGVLDKIDTSTKRVSLVLQLVSWAKPALVMAAAAALLCLVGAAVFGTSDTKVQDETTSPALVLSSWASGQSLPSTAHILSVLGEKDD